MFAALNGCLLPSPAHKAARTKQRPQTKMNKELIDAKDVKSRIDRNWAKVVGAGLFLPASIKVGSHTVRHSA